MRGFTNTSSIGRWTIIMGAAALSLLSGAAQAATIKADFVNVSPSRSFSYTLNGQSMSTSAGVLNWTTIPGGTLNLGNFQAFCIELLESAEDGVLFDLMSLQSGPLPGQDTGGPGVSGPMGVSKANLIRELWGRNFGVLFTGTAAQRNDKCAAFQISIWEIVYDTGLSLASGSFVANNLAQNAVVISQNWLSTLSGDTSKYENRLVALVSPDPDGPGRLHGFQDQVTLPEPASLGMLLLGLVGLARRRS